MKILMASPWMGMISRPFWYIADPPDRNPTEEIGNGQTSLFVIFDILPKFDPIFMDEGLGIVKKTEDMLKIIVLAFQKPKQS